MKKLKIDLSHCYGIKSLKTEFDFAQHKAFAIYAPNGVMKSSLARTFKDLAEGVASKDQIFPSRICTRTITDEKGTAIAQEQVLVVAPYDEVFGHTEKTSTLLVDPKLRKEYEALYVDIDKTKGSFLKALKEQSKSKKDLEKEISATFTKSESEFYRALIRVKDEVLSMKDAIYADVQYDTIFDDKVLSILNTKDFKVAIEDYIRKYNDLIAKSTYFRKGTFDYYNASTIAKNLADNGFFEAEHSVNLKAGGNSRNYQSEAARRANCQREGGNKQGQRPKKEVRRVRKTSRKEFYGTRFL
jgi:hypothetical protein